MQLRTIPRAYVTVALRLSRAPLNLVQRLTGNRANERWSPALAFDELEANTKQALGSAFGDDELVRQGELGHERVMSVREAIELEAAAERKQQRADESLRARAETDEAQRRAAQARAASRSEQAERDRADAKRQAAADERARKARARRREEKRDAELAATERSARASELAKERRALAAKKKATATRAASRATDQKLRATKARRTAS